MWNPARLERGYQSIRGDYFYGGKNTSCHQPSKIVDVAIAPFSSLAQLGSTNYISCSSSPYSSTNSTLGGVPVDATWALVRSHARGATRCVSLLRKQHPDRINNGNMPFDLSPSYPTFIYLNLRPISLKIHLAKYALYIWLLIVLLASYIPTESPAGLTPLSNNRSANSVFPPRLPCFTVPRNDSASICPVDTFLGPSSYRRGT